MTKKEVISHVKKLKKRIVGVLETEKFIMYTGTDAEFAQELSDFYSDVTQVLDSIDNILMKGK